MGLKENKIIKIKIKRSKIEKIIKAYISKNQIISIDKLTDVIWEYIIEVIDKIGGIPVIIRERKP